MPSSGRYSGLGLCYDQAIKSAKLSNQASEAERMLDLNCICYKYT